MSLTCLSTDGEDQAHKIRKQQLCFLFTLLRASANRKDSIITRLIEKFQPNRSYWYSIAVELLFLCNRAVLKPSHYVLC